MADHLQWEHAGYQPGTHLGNQLESNVLLFCIKVITYDHRPRRIGHPVRSAMHKPHKSSTDALTFSKHKPHIYNGSPLKNEGLKILRGELFRMRRGVLGETRRGELRSWVRGVSNVSEVSFYSSPCG